MKLIIVAVGQRLPRWADLAWADYAKRFPRELKVELKAVKTDSRTGGKTAAQAMAAERLHIEQAMPKSAHVVALDEHGAAPATLQLAVRLAHWKTLGSDLVFLIGGPDGLDPALRESAHECLRLSNLTLPHAMARILLIEQLYRAWSINAGHPYHRG
ncbi:MAG: 23S rRNA (pseudouridine(1915)-N(3))-methyltransferase RlmH [Burkholderiaceae bacterium]|nr:MAG: 23S rRNA (pseudouridine(1915)-N(3))-methyltransferase RlmH [Burkholderiaceae bacterium]